MLKIFTLTFGLFFTTTLMASGNGAPKDLALIAKEIDKGQALLIDVREASEISRGMAKPAIWLATSDIRRKSPRYKEIIGKLPKNKTIYVYCASGYRSGTFTSILKNAGMKATNIGGFSSWASAKYPVDSPKNPVSKSCPYLCGSLK